MSTPANIRSLDRALSALGDWEEPDPDWGFTEQLFSLDRAGVRMPLDHVYAPREPLAFTSKCPGVSLHHDDALDDLVPALNPHIPELSL